MQGDYVIVRCYGDKPALRRVVEERGRGTAVCHPDRYEAVVNEYARVPPTAFPRNDVYCYDEQSLVYIEANYQQGDFAWNQLTPYWVRETP